MSDVQIRSLEEAGVIIDSLRTNVEQLQKFRADMLQRMDTLQTPLWKRVWFRIDGWPGQKNLNAEKRSWRPWHGDR